MRRLAVVLAILVALVPAAPALAAPGPSTVTYRPPVDAPVVDAFRPPPEDWNAGNRGLEYATAPGTPVLASAGGEVTFAGQVGGTLHVVVLHADGIRTSYSFLATISVHRGDKVSQGQQLGTTADRFHFGARAGDAYLDPAKLFGDGPPEVHLVPDEDRKPGTEAQERAGVLRLFNTFGAWVSGNTASAVDWAHGFAAGQIAGKLDELRGAILYAHELEPSTHLVRFFQAVRDWQKARATCTAPSVPTPRLQERHVAVLVAGLGSDSTDKASVDDVDTAALGYAPGDVARFSYNGGTTDEHPYGPTDTTVDIHESARRLRELLERVQAAHPGVPIDIIAHSQGGIVARTALTDEVDGADPRLPAIASLIMLGSPNQGAPGSTLLTMLGHSQSGQVLEGAAHDYFPNVIDPAAPSIKQMAEESEFMRRLNSRPLPDGLKVTSIGARGDVIVPAGLTHLDGANNVIVSAPGLNEHSQLPGSPEAQREIALGLAGMSPTCESLANALSDAGVSDVIRTGETAIGAATWLGGRRLDSGFKTLLRPDAPGGTP